MTGPITLPSRMARPSSVFFAMTLWAWSASTAHAESEVEARATDRHRILVGGALGGRWSNGDHTVPWPSLHEWYAYATPELAYFLADGVGIGLSLGGLYGSKPWQSHSLDVDLRDFQYFGGISALLELPLGPRTSLFAIPKLSYVRSGRRVANLTNKGNVSAPGRNIQNQTVLATTSATFEFDSRALRLSLFLPFVVHASDAVLVGFGPEVWFDRALGEVTEPAAHTLFSVGASTWIGLSF